MPKLSKRDKNALIICMAFLLIFLLVEFIFLPVVAKRKNIKKDIQINKLNLAKMIEMQQKYNSFNTNIEGRKDQIKKRGKRFSLFSYLDSTAETCGVKKNVAYIKPSFQDLKNSDYKKAFVKVRLESISLKECVAFLNKIESLENIVNINSFSISTTGKDKKMLDVVFETETLVLSN